MEKNPLKQLREISRGRVRKETKDQEQESTLKKAASQEQQKDDAAHAPEKEEKKQRTPRTKKQGEKTQEQKTQEKERTVKKPAPGTKAAKEAQDPASKKSRETKKTGAAAEHAQNDAATQEKARRQRKNTKKSIAVPGLRELAFEAKKEKEEVQKEEGKKRGRKGKSKCKKVKIIPLGGLEQIGMNITAFEYEDSIIVVDCGLSFPGEDMLGIDLVIPDISYLKDNYLKVKAFCITHGHEDHIGALPYILKQLNVPVYGTRLTIALIERKLKEHNIDKTSKLNIVKNGQTIELGDFKVEYVKTNHSIADACALAISSPAGMIFHSGDFKIDYTPVFGDSIDLQRMAEIGRQGCLAMLCESTNAARPGFTMSERTVGRTFDLIFAEHMKNRIIVATFASNVDRVQQIINTAYKYGRKVVVEGRSMVNVIRVAGELGYIRIPEGTLIDIDHLKDYPPEKTVLITTGSQGESMAALSRMSSSIHKKVSISPNDVIIMSSTPIPGNEKAVNKVINELSIKGAEVIFQDTHVSGHACQEEIKLMYSLLRPKFSLPIHGEYRHRMAQKSIAESMGMSGDNVLMMSAGDVVEVCEDYCKVVNHVEAGCVYVDGLGVGDVGSIVLRDRQNLAQNGIIIIALTLEKGSNRLVSGPDIVSRGFVYIRESGDLMEEAREVVVSALDDCFEARLTDWSKMKNITRDALSDFLWKRIKRNPVILPIIMEV